MPSRTKKLRGSRTHGRGKKAGRGAGKRGGRGNAGLHKHKYMSVIVYDPYHFGRHGFKRPQSVVGLPVIINVKDLEEHVESWIRMGHAKPKGKDGFEIDLTALGYDKLLGNGAVSKRFTVSVAEASEKAVEKINEAGGQVNTSEGGGEGDGGRGKGAIKGKRGK